MTYLNCVIESRTPQSEPVADMVPNSAGGYAYPVGDFAGLHRFLVLGSEGGVPGLTPRMAVARREPNHYLAAFASRAGANSRNRRDVEMVPLDITDRDSIPDAVRKTQALPFGGTDCALPMLDALQKGIPVDCFVLLTDSETWAGGEAGGGGHGVQRVHHRQSR